MSRIGNKPISIPNGVKINLNSNDIMAEGPRGKLNLSINPEIKLIKEENLIKLECKRENEKKYKAQKGLYRMLINNMLVGVSAGYEKKLEVIGTGFRGSVQGKKLVLNIGYSHPVEYDIPDNIKITVEENTKLSISGIDKQLVGQVAANIRRFRPPEPYKGKGIKYSDEIIKRKAGKAAK